MARIIDYTVGIANERACHVGIQSFGVDNLTKQLGEGLDECILCGCIRALCFRSLDGLVQPVFQSLGEVGVPCIVLAVAELILLDVLGAGHYTG